MSLRAKVEAVIYAAEEPVTLLQLAALLRPEVEAELAAQAAAQLAAAAELAAARLALSEPASPGPANQAAADHDPTQVLYFGSDVSIPIAPEPASPSPTPEPANLHSPAQPESLDPTPEPDGPDTPDSPQPASDAAPARPSDRDIRFALRRVLDDLTAEYAASDRGMEIREVAGGFRMATKPEYHDAVRQFVRSLKPPMKLSLPALETLAVVAYKQPVTAPEVADIRGVESAGVLGSLLARKLITTAGRKQVIGRPILYKTTREFLLRFGLRDLKDLPSMEEFEKMAGALAETDEEPITMPESTPQPDIHQPETSENGPDSAAAGHGLAPENGEETPIEQAETPELHQ
jgi:segregation and condensation protein B